MINKYKHIIWDWNGTMLDDVELCKDIMNTMLSKRNLPQISKEKYRDIFTFPVLEYYKKTDLDLSVDSFEDLSIEFISAYEANKYNCSLFDDVKKVLKHTNDQSISQSVLSAYSQDALTELIEHFNLSEYFIRLVGLDNIYAASKIENGKKWMDELNYKPHEVLLIGDSTHDYEVANEIGADCILVSRGHQPEEKLKTTNAIVISALSQLLDK